jgi:AcrR family transcriptional regulator
MDQKLPAPQAPTRRKPKTQRGRDTREEIVMAARRLVSERWVDEIPFTELAAAAGVARASLLHVFPQWRDVLYDLFSEEIARLDGSYAAAVALKRVRHCDRAYAMLVPILDRAEVTGRLYPNLRGAMFTWHGAPSAAEETSDDAFLLPSREMLGAFARIDLGDNYSAVESLLGIPRDESLKPNEFGPSPIGECLVNLALDLAAGSPSYFATFEDRRHTLRSSIRLISAGVRASMSGGTKKRRH